MRNKIRITFHALLHRFTHLLLLRLVNLSCQDLVLVSVRNPAQEKDEEDSNARPGYQRDKAPPHTVPERIPDKRLYRRRQRVDRLQAREALHRQRRRPVRQVRKRRGREAREIRLHLPVHDRRALRESDRAAERAEEQVERGDDRDALLRLREACVDRKWSECHADADAGHDHESVDLTLLIELHPARDESQCDWY